MFKADPKESSGRRQRLAELTPSIGAGVLGLGVLLANPLRGLGMAGPVFQNSTGISK